jgi:uncharacterized protein YjiS (DUF1127 family)
MNVELISPVSVLYLLAPAHAADAQPGHRWVPAWAEPLWARLGEEIRYRRALRQLHQLDQRDLDDLDLARADLPALARRHARGVEPLARIRH